jgi:hypothetical protein
MTALAMDFPSSRSATSPREAGLVLRPTRGHDDAPLIPLAVGRHVLGSSPEADIRLDAAGIEPQHAVLLVGPQRSVLKAFSRFTWINDGVVRECAIRPGDRICIGPVEFEVLKGKAKKRRPASHSPSESSGHLATPHFDRPQSAATLPATTPSLLARAAESDSRRQGLIRELNAELLTQLSQLVERETLAADRERRLVEQNAQIEGRRRSLEARQAELERAQAELSKAEGEWRRKSAEHAEQSALLREDRDAIERQRARLTEEAGRLESQSRQLDDARSELARRESRFDEQRAALELRSEQLCAQEHNLAIDLARALEASNSHSIDVQRLAEERSHLEHLRAQLSDQRQQLEVERSAFESDRDKLFAERAHLAAREVEITELRRQLHEDQASLEAQRAEHFAAAQATVIEPEDVHLGDGWGERLQEQEASLALERRELDDRRRELEEQRAEWMLERHSLAAKSAAEEREAAHAADAEIQMLRHQITELQSRLREERMLWEAERSEWVAQRESEENSTQPEISFESPGSLEAMVAELQATLAAERTQYSQERSAWEAEQDLLLRDRQALEAEWRRLEQETQRALAAPQPDEAIEQFPAPPPIPAQFLNHWADENTEETAASSESTWGSSREINEQTHEELDIQSDFDTAYESDTLEWSQDQPISQASESFDAEESSDADATETMHSSSAAGGGDVMSLRAQLAELFGIQPSEPQHDFDQIVESGDAEIRSENELPPDNFDAEIPSEPACEPVHAATRSFAHDHGGTEGQSDEEIMQAYLAKLLKKTPEQLSETPSSTPLPVVAVVATPETTEPSEAASAESEDQTAEPHRLARRLNAEEKEVLRANLDSFRELANQQARAAVAKHKSKELQSGMQTTSVVTVLAAVAGAILLTAEFWTSQSYRVYGIICLALAAGVGTYTLINGLRIRRLKAVQRAAVEMTEAFGDDEPASTETPAAEEATA